MDLNNSWEDEQAIHIDQEQIDRAVAMMRLMGLGQSISDAFRDADPVNLRRWYVETFVLDPYNLPMLSSLTGNPVLLDRHEKASWVSTEHAAIGNRLLFAMCPDKLFHRPNHMESDEWNNPIDVSGTMMRLLSPWDTIRYEPETENWYKAVHPGQWQRYGKGAPGQNMAEAMIDKWLTLMSIDTNPDLYKNFAPDPEGWDVDEFVNRLNGSIFKLRKYRVTPMATTHIRKIMERSQIMYLDSATLNKIRTMAPFANGALALVRSSFTDTLDRKHTIEPGQLLPLDIEYMVTNANTLTWHDQDKRIPRALNSTLSLDGDFLHLDELQDELLLSKCPTYWSFLTHTFPEPEERSAFLRLLGAAMYGTNLKIVAAMIGEPNAGKDTVINWLSYLMPGQVAHLPFSAFTPYGDDDRGFAPLLGARVATVSGEVGEGRGSKLLAEKIKTVSSGGGSLRVAEKYEKPTTIWFDGMLFLQGNSVPTIAGGDRALYTNRLVAVEFKYPFELQAKSYEPMYRAEAPYFAQVLFLNYIQYQHGDGGMKGIDPPQSWRNFAKEFANSSNPHGFMEACIVPSDKAVPTQQFHQALSAMIAKFGSPFPVGPNYWPKRLRTLGFPTNGPKSVRKQIGPNKTWSYMLTLDSELSDGSFTQQQWDNCLRDAAVTV